MITTARRPHRKTRPGTSPLETYEPTREEIMDMCEQIQEEWTPAEREKRRAVPMVPWTVPESPSPSI